MRDNCDGEIGGTMMSRAMSYVINCTRIAQACQAERSCVSKKSETGQLQVRVKKIPAKPPLIMVSGNFLGSLAIRYSIVPAKKIYKFRRQ